MYKNPDYEYELIPVSEINAGNGRISHKCAYPALGASIEANGLITPLIVCRSGGRFEIISGFKRFDIIAKNTQAQTDGSVKIKCLVVKDLAPADRLWLNISENAASRGLNPVEEGEALKKLSAFYDKTVVIEKYMPAMSMQKSEYVYNRSASLCALIGDAKTSLVNGKLPLQAAAELVKFSSDEQRAFMDMAAATGMGANLLNETARLLFETAMQYGKTAGEIMAMASIASIIEDAKMTSNQKTETIRVKLHALKRPMYETAMARFRELAGEFEARRISVNPFAYFEKDELSVKFSITSAEDLSARIDALERLKKSRLAEEFLSGRQGGKTTGRKGKTSND
ncbi:MAG: hypothetical protein A2008_09390 [Candidatus Wallbacteria bacterium GWC2_49_35]|uniref:ParB-like N-terminal domain-containing protein n=1 Tax=Candidatus Wallbacteria bacterium GWC2_49_35 TaxID=1817813 RepID=A0A1F7WI97_9BACT|nr:MAG: hypothetical protein A2008_09390 [Candidatus Wallbacteria bacterium GWC2_49_35]HBC73247.1 hypothetical protein [Candidatus Wallbacteria bacterium]